MNGNYLAEWGEFARLILAYLLVQYALQPPQWSRHKTEKVWKSPWLYGESLLMGTLAYLFWGKWTIETLWIIPVLMLGHVLLEGFRQMAEKKYGERSLIFLLGFFLHLGLLFLVWDREVIRSREILQSGLEFASQPEVWLIALGYFIVWFPAGYMMKLITLPWQRELEDTSKGLSNAGRWIGVMERTLVLTFVLNNSISAIGLLIAAKSVLRFGEIKDHENRKEAEYILIGTLLSFSIAILLGLWIRSVLLGGHFPIEEVKSFPSENS